MKSAKKELRRAERKWSKTRLQSDFVHFKAKKNQATSTKGARIDYYYFTVIQKNRADQRKMFRSAKSLFEQEADLTFRGPLLLRPCNTALPTSGNGFSGTG